jgi:DNA-binding transcriptional regulator LsrR (DeoR family)
VISCVRAINRHTDSVPNHRKRKLDKEMVRVAADRYAKGETMAELARDYDVSEPTIWRALQGPFVVGAGA